MIMIKQEILINYHEFLNISELINFISFLKDTGKSWDIFYQFMEFRHLANINNVRNLNTIGILSFTSEFYMTLEAQFIKVWFAIDTNHQFLSTIWQRA